MTTAADIKDPLANDGGENSMNETQGFGRKVFIETYGCQMNLADSELMGGLLSSKGYRAAESLEDADVILINTCAVREKAEERVFGRLANLLPLKHEKPNLILGVTGCMANHLKETILKRAPYVDLVVGPDAYRRLGEALETAQSEQVDPLIDVKLDREETYQGVQVKRRPGINAWISVQRGCDKFCSFCVVPFTRGRERGVAPDEVMKQVRDVAESGYKEITLLGQTVNSYKYDDVDFADLLRQIVEVDGIERIRFTSPYPTDFTPKLIETIASQEKICNYIHIPAQSGSNKTLSAMRRQYTREGFDELIVDVRTAIPDIAISTDIIVGYPGETEEDFQETMDLIRSTRFDFAFLFAYSERGYTYASRNVPDDVDPAVKKDRLVRVIDLQESIRGEVYATRLGSTFDVMIEGESRRDTEQWCGRTDDYKMTVFDKDSVDRKPGDVVQVEIARSTSHTLIGTLV